MSRSAVRVRSSALLFPCILLADFITAGAVMGYATVPLAFGALRRQEPNLERPFRLPAGEVLAPIAFIAANLLIYWAGWTVIWKLFVAIGLGFVLLAVAHATNGSERPLEWRGSRGYGRTSQA